jgi:RNA polymerase sigma-70 factor (ECF subfamily)
MNLLRDKATWKTERLPVPAIHDPARTEDDLLRIQVNVVRLLDEPIDSGEEDGKIATRHKNADAREQIATLYDEYYPRVYGYLLSLNTTREEAEELAQEAFLRLLAQLADGQEIEKPQGWVIRVAHNLAVNLQRRNALRRSGTHEEGWTFPDPPDPALNQEERCLVEERNWRLDNALMSMNPQHRECFLMRAQGLSYSEIGGAMNISMQRAAIIVKRAATRLAVICG